VAHVKWGGAWGMPSKEQIDELINNCTSIWTTNGRWFAGTNGGRIFLPAAGDHNDSGIGDVGSDGFYWSSTLDPSVTTNAYYLDFNSNYADWYYVDRYIGQCVRPVVRN